VPQLGIEALSSIPYKKVRAIQHGQRERFLVAERYILRPEEGEIEAGNKASLLRFLIDQGHSVPATCFCSLQALEDAKQDAEGVIDQLRAELARVISDGKAYAVRSSANVEDTAESSYAGQFTTSLGVSGVPGVLEAIEEVWRSAESARVRSYLGKKEIRDGEIRMGVIIQEMVEPDFSGVSFSRNPMTGMDEVLVEAVKGRGTALVQDGATPGRWINKRGKWLLLPQHAHIPLDLIESIVRETKVIEKEYGRPVDLEWVYDGRQILWVQLREILIDDVNVYSNKISKEVLPGAIKPLVWSVNIPLVNGAWIRLFTELIGENDIQPESLSKQIHYRAYFNMGVIGRIFSALGMPRESLELLMGIEAAGKTRFRPTWKTMLQLPRLVAFAVDKLRFSRRLEAFLPEMQERYRGLAEVDLATKTDDELFSLIERLFDLTQEAAYFNIVVPLLMQIYNRLLSSRLSEAGISIEELDLTRRLEGLRELDPKMHLAKLHEQYARLCSEAEGELGGSHDAIREIPGSETFRAELDLFIERFGHFSESGTDFSAVPWRENPQLVLDMIAGYRPKAEAELQSLEDLRIPLMRRPAVRILYGRARQYRLARERVSSLYTYGYGLFRNYYLEVGRRLTTSGSISRPDDIFYLYLHEVEAMFSADGGSHSMDDHVRKRRAEMEAYRDISLPTIVYGDRPPPILERVAEELKGTPTSRGYYTGPARVITSTGEFAKLQEGDVLVVPYSDVAWTPLFAKAGAVVAESGGILSHSSIVAREFGIPAVVSVDGATRLKDGAIVSVDGFTGDVVLHDDGAKSANDSEHYPKGRP
jgi:pyruvate,water dikinase